MYPLKRKGYDKILLYAKKEINYTIKMITKILSNNFPKHLQAETS